MNLMLSFIRVFHRKTQRRYISTLNARLSRIDLISFHLWNTRCGYSRSVPPHEKLKKTRCCGSTASLHLVFLHQVSSLTDDFYHLVDIHHAYGRNIAGYFWFGFLDFWLLIILVIHKQMMENAQHFSGQRNGCNILLSASCQDPLEKSL